MNSQQKILVVDDDPAIVKLLEGLLSKDYEVFVARDGLEAMVQVKKHQPQLIILDVMMPEINGYDVCRNLKFDSEYESIPILLLTSRNEEIDPRIAQMMGVSYMQKPVNTEALLSKIVQIFKK